MEIEIINGPNLNLLGVREPGIYGSEGFDTYLAALRQKYPDVTINYYQSNEEGKLIDRIHATGFTADGIILNAGAYTHTSIALHDAIRAVPAPVVEVHISNVHKREEFRRKSMISPACTGVICGFGLDSYRLAVEGVLLRMLVRMLRPRNILEIGTFTGYSAIAMSYGLDGDGHIYTYDVNDELEDFARGWIENSREGHRITYTIGNVLEVLPPVADGTGLRFDLAFIDGDKRQYPEYYRLCKRYLSHGGYILADNTLWDGHVIDHAYDRDAQTLGIRAFNDLVAADTECEKVIIPMRDGITLIHLKDK